jgi:hypothetical protein
MELAICKLMKYPDCLYFTRVYDKIIVRLRPLIECIFLNILR